MFRPTDDNLRVSGGLTHSFINCDTCLSDEEFNRLRQQEFAEKEFNILQGQFSGSVAGLQERGPAVSAGQSKQAEQRQEEDRRTKQLIELVENIRISIERLESEIKGLEDIFRADYGEAWREQLALEILGEDDIPQRQAGESMLDYRERLETVLIDEMLNPDGSIKDQYKDHPELGDYAEWAQKQYHLHEAQSAVAELENNSTSPERREQILNEMLHHGSAEEVMLAAKNSIDQNVQQEIKQTDDANHDATSQADKSSARNSFLNLQT